jgi:hypothetical protein
VKELAQLLAASQELRSENFLTLENVRESIAEYLAMHAEEVQRFPKEKKRPHWSLIAADYDSKKDAQFLAMHFSKDKVTFLAGRGEILKVRRFVESDFPENPNEVLPELAKLFDTSPHYATYLSAVEEWLAE